MNHARLAASTIARWASKPRLSMTALRIVITSTACSGDTARHLSIKIRSIILGAAFEFSRNFSLQAPISCCVKGEAAWSSDPPGGD
jgi:hypothetical protein